MRGFRWVCALGLATLPFFLKNPLYRWLFGYRIGRGVRIGFSPFIDVRRCRIGDYTRIGSFNAFTHIRDLDIGERARIGKFNVFRGGDRIAVGAYTTILRLNVFNAIIDIDAVSPPRPVLDLGSGVFIATAHWFDFTGGIRIDAHCIIGGRNSSFWTHNRQRLRSITVGCHTYLGSEIRAAPGVKVPAFSIVALGSVLTGALSEPRILIGGNPASVVRKLKERDLFLVTRKTRNDIPDDVAQAWLPEDLKALARKGAALAMRLDEEDALRTEQP